MGSNVNNKGCTLPMYLECAYNWYLLILENGLYKIFLTKLQIKPFHCLGTNHACCHNYFSNSLIIHEENTKKINV